MRVMFAVPSYWPSQDGVANITKYLAEGLADQGHEVWILTSTGNGGLQDLPAKEVHRKVQVERMRIYVQWPLHLKGRDPDSTKTYYRKRIKEIGPDVLVVVCAQTWTFDWIRDVLDEVKCKKIFYSHGYSKLKAEYDYLTPLKNRNVIGVLEVLKTKRYYKSLYQYLQKYDKAIYLTEENNSARYAAEHHLTNGKIIGNAIEDAFYEEKNRHDYSTESPILQYLFVANYSANKNQEMLLRAFAGAKIGKSRLVFIGFEENPYLDRLRKLQNELAISGEKEVLFETHLDRQEIIKIYGKSDVFVCPSLSETWSIVAHEAAAAAIPVISTNVGIYSELDGCMIVNTEQEMTRAMEELYFDGEKRRTKGMQALNWLLSQNCSVKDKVTEFENVLKELTS